VRLGILGGSFDPIHHGHLIVAQLAREALVLDRVLLMVSANQPLKERHGAAAVHRLRMTELACEGMAGVAADGREVTRGGTSFTVDTLRELTLEHPDAELVLLLGGDAAAQLPRWREVEEVLRLARVVVFARAGAPIPDGFDEIRVPAIDISSTEIRSRAARGLPLRGWVPERVADYISGLDLYRTQGGAG
jgi:nicotinate-nucleotide adenylyltransferase